MLLRVAADRAATMPGQAAELAQQGFSLVPADHPWWLAVGARPVILAAIGEIIPCSGNTSSSG